jgi:hypothetical protein
MLLFSEENEGAPLAQTETLTLALERRDSPPLAAVGDDFKNSQRLHQPPNKATFD